MQRKSANNHHHHHHHIWTTKWVGRRKLGFHIILQKFSQIQHAKNNTKFWWKNDIFMKLASWNYNHRLKIKSIKSFTGGSQIVCSKREIGCNEPKQNRDFYLHKKSNILVCLWEGLCWNTLISSPSGETNNSPDCFQQDDKTKQLKTRTTPVNFCFCFCFPCCSTARRTPLQTQKKEKIPCNQSL